MTDALEVVQARLAFHPDDLELLLIEGRAWLLEGDLLRAQTALLRAARVAPVAAEPFRWLGEVLLRRGDPERANKVLDRAHDLDPHDRTISALKERAARLARVAVESSAPAYESFDSPGFGEDDESTVVAPVPPAMVAASVPPPSPAIVPTDFDDDEGPTSLLDRAGFATVLSRPAAKTPAPVKATGTLPYSAPSPSVPPPMPAPPPRAANAGRPAPRSAPVAPPPPAAPVSPFRTTQAGLGVESPPTNGSEPSPARWSSAPPPPVSTASVPPPRPSVPPPRPSAPPLRSSAPPPETADAVLATLQAQGVFELPTSDVAGWAGRGEVTRSGTRTGWALGFVWLLGLAAVGGGVFAYHHFTGERKAEASRRLERAEQHVLSVSGLDWRAADDELRTARELDPKNVRIGELRLKLELARVLEASGQVGALRAAIGSVERENPKNELLPLAEAWSSFLEGKITDVRGALASLGDDERDAWRAYAAGRLGQRLGDERASARLARALSAEPKLAAAALALATAHLDEGKAVEAREVLDAFLARTPNHLRGRLLRVYAETGPDAKLAPELATRVDAEGIPEEKVLAQLLVARSARERGDGSAARAALQRAFELGISEPLLSTLLAREAFASGLTQRAQQLASQAVTLAPGQGSARVLLAEILLRRGDGAGALRTLRALSSEDPVVLRLSAEAALLVGDDAALSSALESLDGALGRDGVDPALRALRIRVIAAQGNVGDALSQAKKLAKEVPGDAAVLFALGETALAARDAKLAIGTLEKLVALDPEEVRSHYLLGRARRLSGDAEGAKSSFETVLAKDPEHTEASVALGHLELDRGEFGAALTRFEQLGAKRTGPLLVAKLGRLEALLGLLRIDDAKRSLDELSATDRELPSVKVMSARVALASGQAGEAVKLLRPLAEAENASADVIALFGDALYRIDEVDAAKARYDAALKIDAGHPEALVGAAEVHVRAEKTKDAFAVIERAEASLARRIRPPSLAARLLVLRARARLDRKGSGDLDAARGELRRAIDMPGVPPEAHFFLGEALAGANSPESKAAYERYLELDPKGLYVGRARRALR